MFHKLSKACLQKLACKSLLAKACLQKLACKSLLAKYSLRAIRFHDLRHSCATIMLYLGYTLKDIQTWLGHSNYYFTADTYIHSAPSAHLQMANTLSEQLEALLPLIPIGEPIC